MPATAAPEHGVRLTKGERTRRSILDAALKVIAESGVDGVTHRSVAAEAGVTHGTLTYHFASRDDIVLGAFRHHIETFSAGLDALYEEVEDADWAIEDLATELLRRQLADRDRLAAEYELVVFASRNEGLAREYRRWQRSLEHEIAEAFELLGVPRPHEAARIVGALMRAFELGCLTDPDKDPAELGRQLRRIMPALVDDDDAPDR